MKLSHTIGCVLIPLMAYGQLANAGDSVERRLEVPSKPWVKLKVHRGSVTLTSWDKDEVRVEGNLDDLSEGLVLEQRGNKILIEDKMPRRYKGDDEDGSRLIITLPRRVKLEAEGVSASYRLTALSGSITVDSVSGDIHASELGDHTELHTVSGDIITDALSGKIKLDTVSGTIEDKQSQGDVGYRLVSGELQVSSQAQHVSVEQVSGDGRLDLGRVDTLEVKTVSGDLDFKLAELGSKARLSSVSGDLSIEFETTPDINFDLNGGPGGKIRNDLTQDEVSKDKYSPNTYLKFQAGNGKADLKASTISGDIRLVR